MSSLLMQTANLTAVLTRLDMSLIEVALNSQLLLANSVRFEPMNFGKVNRTIIEAYISNSF